MSKKTESASDDTPSKKEKAKDAVATVPVAAVTAAKFCISTVVGSKSYLTLFNVDGPFGPGATVTGNITSATGGGIWTPHRRKANDPKHLHLKLTCTAKPSLRIDPITGRPIVPTTGDLTIVVSSGSSPVSVPVVYADDDPAD